MPADADDTAAACSAWDNSRCEGTAHCQPRCPRAFDDDGRPFVVRPRTDGDRDGLLAMYDDVSAETSTLGLPPLTRRQTERWLDGLAADGTNLLAVAEGRIAGHAAAVPADSPNPELVVFVHPEHRGRGVGSELLKQLVAYAAADDHESLTLLVDEDNRRAVHVYDNIGFDVADRLRDELKMVLDLEAPISDRVRRPPADRSDTA
jgi:GNAT superfamily N-acetyltransferase